MLSKKFIAEQSATNVEKSLVVVGEAHKKRWEPRV